jgi:hypothetical protein
LRTTSAALLGWGLSVGAACVLAVAGPGAEPLYRLPWAAGQVYRCTQSFNGSTSHKGQLAYSLDFAMVEGTEVVAARGGEVVKAVDDETDNGAQGKYGGLGNHVRIAHGDGTFGMYLHLKPGGVKVREGEHVLQGDVIGLSGNTGRSTGPHLHLHVCDASGQSMPIRFADVDEPNGVPASDKRYTSGNVAGIPARAKDRLRALERAAREAATEGAWFVERDALEKLVRVKVKVDYPPQAAAAARLGDLEGAASALADELRALGATEPARAAERLVLEAPGYRGLPGAAALKALERELGSDPAFKEAAAGLRARGKLRERLLKGLKEELLGNPLRAGRDYAYVAKRGEGTDEGARAAERLAALEERIRASSAPGGKGR